MNTSALQDDRTGRIVAMATVEIKLAFIIKNLKFILIVFILNKFYSYYLIVF